MRNEISCRSQLLKTPEVPVNRVQIGIKYSSLALLALKKSSVTVYSEAAVIVNLLRTKTRGGFLQMWNEGGEREAAHAIRSRKYLSCDITKAVPAEEHQCVSKQCLS